MSTKNEKDRAKQIQEKCQTILDQLLKDEDNKYCVDCDAKGPRWASWNLGIFLCIRCAGIHRNLGVHISKVKSVNLDTWTPEQVVSLQQMGNSRARAVYEANLPDAFRRPQTDSALEAFIRAKYEHRKYVAREWVPPSPPQVNWDKEIDEELEKQKKKKKSSASSNTSLGSTALPSPADKKSTKPIEVPQLLPKPKSSASPKAGRTTPKRDVTLSAGTADLLGTSSLAGSEPKSQTQQVEDVFSSFLSAPQQTTTADTNKNVEQSKPVDLKTEEENFFNQPAPSAQEKSKMTKDSILALYGQAPTQSAPSQSFAAPTAFNPQFPSQIQFPQTQNAFPQGFGSFPTAQTQSFPVQNGAMSQSTNLAGLGVQNAALGIQNAGIGVQNTGLGAQNAGLGIQNAGLGGQNAGFGNFNQFSNTVQPQQNNAFSQFSSQSQSQFQQPSAFGHTAQNSFSSMPTQFNQQQMPSQFPNMNGFSLSNSQNGGSLNGQQFFSTQQTNLQQQFGNMSLGQGANSFAAGPQSLNGVFQNKSQPSSMTANSVWQ